MSDVPPSGNIEALSRGRTDKAMSDAIVYLSGNSALDQGARVEARACHEEGLTLSRKSGNVFRYPVKSMPAERFEGAQPGRHGLDGDRRLHSGA
jgi:hypothetical protein